MDKQYFNIFNGQDGFFVSHQSNGAKGQVDLGKSKAGNPIMILRVELGGKTFKGILNKNGPEVLAKNKKSPHVWGNVEDGRGGKYKVAGWWSVKNKNGEPYKMPFFACNLEPVTQENSAGTSGGFVPGSNNPGSVSDAQVPKNAHYDDEEEFAGIPF